MTKKQVVGFLTQFKLLDLVETWYEDDPQMVQVDIEGDLEIKHNRQLTSAQHFPQQVIGTVLAGNNGPGFDESLAAERLLL